MKKEQFIHINKSGDTRYYSDREMKTLHREDGPAIESAYGYKSWWLYGELYREDGPAVECADGYKEWWLNGEKLTEEEFNERIDPPEVTLTYEEIAAMFNVLADKLKIKK